MLDHDVVVVGSANLDRIVRVARIPAPGETVVGELHQLAPGGKGANQAAAASRLGMSVALVAAVGDDAAGELLIAELRSAGVDLQAIKRDPARPTGEALILLEAGGENSMVVPGANGGLTPQDLGEVERLARARHCAILLQCEIPMATVFAALERSRGRLRVLNPAPASAVTARVLAEVDVLVPNRVELSELAGFPVTSLDEARAAITTLPVPRIVVTMGDQGALVRDDGRIHHVPAPPVQVVDTTGAGDAFCAALTVALVEGKAPSEAAEYAVHAASLSTQAVGAQAGHPSAEASTASWTGATRSDHHARRQHQNR